MTAQLSLGDDATAMAARGKLMAAVLELGSDNNLDEDAAEDEEDAALVKSEATVKREVVAKEAKKDVIVEKENINLKLK